MPKLNCWEFMQCEREKELKDADKSGGCPALKESKLNTIHDGSNAGRACWVVSGTFCNGAKQGTFAQKEKNCIQCNFYQMVRKEEGNNFLLGKDLKKILGIK